MMAKAKQLKSGNWRVQATAGGQTKSFTNPERKIAEAEAKLWQAGLKEKVNKTDMTLGEAYDSLIKIKNNVLSPSTIIGYSNLRKTALQDIMSEKISELTNAKIQRSINVFAATHSPKSVRNCYGLLSAVLRMYRPDFSMNIMLPKKEVKQLHIPTDEDVQKALLAAKGTDCYIPILLAAFCGMREGEICALTKDDIKGNYIIINKSMVQTPSKNWVIKPPKTYSSNRMVEVPAFVIDALKEKTGKLVNRNPHANAVAFSRILKKNNIPHFRFHDLRHYYVSSLHAMNIPDKYIQTQGGWSTNYTMNNVYKHIITAQQSEFSKQIGSHFSKITEL